MAEYIEREALLEDMTTTILPRDAQHLYLAMRGKVRNAPAADVVEVVRCKDCKYLEITLPYGECGKYLRIVSPDDYCSCGAKMDGKGEGE